MAHGFIRYGAQNAICPICGWKGNDHCGRQNTDDGELIVCKRTERCAAEGITIFNADGSCYGKDGQYYLRVGTSRSGAGCFMEAGEKLATDIRKGITVKPINFKMPEYVPPKQKVVVDEVKPWSDEKLHKAYSSMISHLKLEDYHRKYLHKEGWTDEMIKKYKIVSFPEKDFTRYKFRKDVKLQCPYRKKLAKMILEDLGNPPDGLRGLPGAYRLDNGEWTFSGRSGIIFLQKNIEGEICGIRTRMDFRDVNTEILKDSDGKEFFLEGTTKWFLSMSGAYRVLSDGTVDWNKNDSFKGKYRPLTSFYEDEQELKNDRIVNVYKDGCQSENHFGFECDPLRDDMHICYITEGEKKGKFSNFNLKAPVVELPGVTYWYLLFEGPVGKRPIDKLIAKGIKYFIMAYDADKKINKDVLSQEQKAIDELKKLGIYIGVAEWDMTLGKGLDDLLAAGYKPRYTVC